jgi:antitoxin YefM
MTIETTESEAGTRLSSLIDRVIRDGERVIIRRRQGDAVVLISATELASLVETAHLLRSPKNAKRLLSAIERSRRGEGKPASLDELRGDLWLDAAEG